MNRTETKAYLVEHKGGHCLDCGGVFPLVCFDFDHRDPEKKSFCVSIKMNSRPPLAELIAEVDKCDLVCANGHRLRTANSEKLRTRRSKSMLGRVFPPRSEQWKRKQREAQTGKKKPAISKALRGVCWTEERRAAKRGTHWSPARRLSYEQGYKQERTNG